MKIQIKLIVLQSKDDLVHHINWWHNLNYKERLKIEYNRYPHVSHLDSQEAKAIARNNIQDDSGIYMTAKEKLIQEKDYYYYITSYTVANGTYEQWKSYLSIIDKSIFLNIPYREYNSDKTLEKNGFFFVKIIKINADYDTVTTAVIKDSTLMSRKSSLEVRERIEQNMNKSFFYSDTLHFYKVNGYHLELKDAIKMAN